MRKSTSPTTPKPTSTNTTMQITTQLTPQQKAKSQLVSAPNFCGHSQPCLSHLQYNPQMIQPANPTPNTATTNQHPPLTANQMQATTTHDPSTSHPKTANSSTQYPKLQPIDQPATCPPNVNQPDPTLCSTNYMVGKHPAPLQHINPSNGETKDLAHDSQYKNYPWSPKTKALPVSKCAINSLPSKDPTNSLTTLKEVISSLNKKLTQLLSIYTLLPIIVCHNQIFPRFTPLPYATPHTQTKNVTWFQLKTFMTWWMHFPLCTNSSTCLQ